MKGPALFGAAALIAGCATAATTPARDWLVGSWLRISESDDYPRLCDSGLPIHYFPDGTWRVFEGDGTWRLEGDRLIETTLDTTADELPPPSTSRIVRIGPDEFRVIRSNGAAATFRRCPAEP